MHKLLKLLIKFLGWCFIIPGLYVLSLWWVSHIIVWVSNVPSCGDCFVLNFVICHLIGLFCLGIGSCCIAYVEDDENEG